MGAPPEMPGDIERRLWDCIPANLQGRKVDAKELADFFPSDEEYRSVGFLEAKDKYLIFGQRSRKHCNYLKRIAYGCLSCNNIVIGPPVIEDDLSIRAGMPLAGREGYDVSCRLCSAGLDEATFAIS